MHGTSKINDGLLMIHRIISRNLTNAIQKCKDYESAKEISSEESRGFTMYVKTLRNITHAHHLAEESIIFSYFRESLDGPYDLLGTEHKAITKSLDQLDRSLASSSSNRYIKIRSHLEKINSMWKPHIKLEEDLFTPEKLNEICDEDEQQKLAKRVAEHGQRNSGPAPLTLPFVIYSLEGRERAALLSELPWIVKKILVPIIWKRQWKPMKPFLLSI